MGGRRGEGAEKNGDRQTTVSLFVENRPDGSPLLEEVLVQRIAESRYRALSTPGLLAGLAAGDEFDVGGPVSAPTFTVVKRGGNVGVQFFAPEATLPACERVLAPRVAELGGRLDGRDRRLLVWTIPVSAGFSAIEQVFFEARKQYPDCQWMYSNVYDPKDGKTPLNWWK